MTLSRTVDPAEYPGAYDTDGKFRVSEKAAKLIEAHNGRAVKFRDLPVLAQCALVQYMAVAGEAWDLPDEIDPFNGTQLQEFCANMVDYLGYYVADKGDVEFGYIEAVPIKALIDSVMHDAEIAGDYASWQSYHDQYMRGFSDTKPGKPKHEAKQMWPVILSGFWDETLEDGWTRFHQYTERGEETCPALFYLHKPMRRLTLPGLFWRDHFNRCLDHPGQRNVIRDNGRPRVTVKLDCTALDNLKSDAEYYSVGVDNTYPALIRSAKATVKAIERQMTRD